MWGQRGGGGVLTRFSAVTLHKSGILSIVFWRLLVTSSILSLPGRSNSPPMESIHLSSMSYIRGSVRRPSLQCVHSCNESNGGWGYWKSKCCTVLGSHMDGKPWTMRMKRDRSHGNPVCPWERTGGGFTALVVGRILIWTMHFRLCMSHLIHKGLFIDEALFVQHVPTRLGNRPQPILVRCFHDGGRVSVLVVCGCAARATHE